MLRVLDCSLRLLRMPFRDENAIGHILCVRPKGCQVYPRLQLKYALSWRMPAFLASGIRATNIITFVQLTLFSHMRCTHPFETRVQCKMIGRRNKYSMIYAFFDALAKHRGIESVARGRGKRILSLQREMAGRFA